MMLKAFSFDITGKTYILNHIKIENSYLNDCINELFLLELCERKLYRMPNFPDAILEELPLIK